MLRLFRLSLVLIAAFATQPSGAEEKAVAVKITVDVADAPELKEWTATARRHCEKWYPTIAAYLKSDGFTPSREVKIVLKKDFKGIAATGGSTITISAKYVTDHPEDFGMVIHELTHVVQSYPKYDPVWLVEGIADYVRFWQFEPDAKRAKINFAKATYRDGYQTAAAFLAWAVEKHDKDLVKKLNEALRAGKYLDELFKERTGKKLDDLWDDFVKMQRRD